MKQNSSTDFLQSFELRVRVGRQTPPDFKSDFLQYSLHSPYRAPIQPLNQIEIGLGLGILRGDSKIFLFSEMHPDSQNWFSKLS